MRPRRSLGFLGTTGGILDRPRRCLDHTRETRVNTECGDARAYCASVWTTSRNFDLPPVCPAPGRGLKGNPVLFSCFGRFPSPALAGRVFLRSTRGKLLRGRKRTSPEIRALVFPLQCSGLPTDNGTTMDSRGGGYR